MLPIENPFYARQQRLIELYARPPSRCFPSFPPLTSPSLAQKREPAPSLAARHPPDAVAQRTDKYLARRLLPAARALRGCRHPLHADVCAAFVVADARDRPADPRVPPARRHRHRARAPTVRPPPPGFPVTRAAAFRREARPFPPHSPPIPSPDTIGGDYLTVSRLLEEFRTVFESEAVLDAIPEACAVDSEAWSSLHGHRGGTGGWDQCVARLVQASQDDVRSNRGDKEVILLRGDLDDLADGHEGGRPALEKLTRSVLEGLREKGR